MPSLWKAQRDGRAQQHSSQHDVQVGCDFPQDCALLATFSAAQVLSSSLPCWRKTSELCRSRSHLQSIMISLMVHLTSMNRSTHMRPVCAVARVGPTPVWKLTAVFRFLKEVGKVPPA